MITRLLVTFYDNGTSHTWKIVCIENISSGATMSLQFMISQTENKAILNLMKWQGKDRYRKEFEN